MNLCTCGSDRTITCVVHPNYRKAQERIAELEREVTNRGDIMAVAIRCGHWVIDGMCDPDHFLTEEQRKFAHKEDDL